MDKPLLQAFLSTLSVPLWTGLWFQSQAAVPGSTDRPQPGWDFASA